MGKTLTVTLPNGIVISNASSEEQAIRVAKQLLTKEVKSVEYPLQKAGTETKVTPKRAYHKKKGKRVVWTNEEDLFVLNNLSQGPAFLRKSFLNERHTKGAISMRYYMISSDNYEKYLAPSTAAIVRQHRNNLVNKTFNNSNQ